MEKPPKPPSPIIPAQTPPPIPPPRSSPPPAPPPLQSATLINVPIQVEQSAIVPPKEELLIILKVSVDHFENSCLETPHFKELHIRRHEILLNEEISSYQRKLQLMELIEEFCPGKWSQSEKLKETLAFMDSEYQLVNVVSHNFFNTWREPAIKFWKKFWEILGQENFLEMLDSKREELFMNLIDEFEPFMS